MSSPLRQSKADRKASQAIRDAAVLIVLAVVLGSVRFADVVPKISSAGPFPPLHAATPAGPAAEPAAETHTATGEPRRLQATRHASVPPRAVRTDVSLRVVETDGGTRLDVRVGEFATIVPLPRLDKIDVERHIERGLEALEQGREKLHRLERQTACSASQTARAAS